VISSIKADESVGILRDYSEETLLNSHGLDETVEKLSDLLCSIRRRRKGRADYTLATKRKCWTGRLRASPCQCDVGCVESLRRPAVRGAAIGVMLLDREAAWRQYQHRSGRRGRTLKRRCSSVRDRVWSLDAHESVRWSHNAILAVESGESRCTREGPRSRQLWRYRTQHDSL